jgi:hypothetical protein
LQAQANGNSVGALAGATPFLRLFGLAAGGAWLAKGGLADTESGHAIVARFFAENFLPECAALKSRVTDGGESLQAASRLLAVA